MPACHAGGHGFESRTHRDSPANLFVYGAIVVLTTLSAIKRLKTNTIMRAIELLSPAKNADIGIEAIKHGADAVYIGPPSFGARAAAGNSIADITRLCDYAHLFNAKVYVTLNTIIYDEELVEVEKLIHALYTARVDALIIQDLGILRMQIPPIALHASTQMDITSVEKARFLAGIGLSQLVLARELSLETIHEIHAQVDAPLEAFVHGALCVSYSGRCYASQACFNRSANRGKCAQLCRFSFDLLTDKGQVLEKQKHLLSMKDLNRSQSIEDMIEAGISSFKIEGRLKDMDYVKNVTAYYRRQIDNVIRKNKHQYCRSSFGITTLSFEPNVEKSFNRSFTNYFLYKRENVANIISPKSMGAYVGTVEQVSNRQITLKSLLELQPGDGLCFVNAQEKLEGFRVNRVKDRVIFPTSMPKIDQGTKVYRNLDYTFVRTLEKPTAERKMALNLTFQASEKGFTLSAEDAITRVKMTLVYKKEVAKQSQESNILRQLSKLGGVPFYIEKASIDGNWFIPSSQLAEWRRQLIDNLIKAHLENHQMQPRGIEDKRLCYPKQQLDFTANIANHLARAFYSSHGVTTMEDAYEVKQPQEAVLMTCKHCIRYTLHQCLKDKNANRKNWLLRSNDGRLFPLKFDCKLCEMLVLSPKN